MATKVYTVVKDGETIKETKTLPSAKKAADENDAEVFCDGLCIYKGTEAVITAEPVVAETSKQPEVQEQVAEQYRLKALMNVRKEPATDAEVLCTKPAGTVVRVTELKDDWLHLTDNSFILYDGGKFAEKV